MPHDSLEALEAEIERVGAERVAAVFVEPVIGAGGVHQPPPGYIEGVAELCARTGVLFVVDAVICAFGRLGTWFGGERFGVRAGHDHLRQGRHQRLPAARRRRRQRPRRRAVLGATATVVPPRPDVLRPPHRAARPRWPTSTSSSARGCWSAASSSRARSTGRCATLEGAPLVGEVRAGIGALGAVAFAADALAEAPDLPYRLFGACRERGLFLRPTGDAIAFSPPLVITREQVDGVAETLGEALQAVARDVRAAVG